jgi:DNA invertase Pin-like site-specific DNA recombinase
MNTKARAYSYLRFSSPEQIKGDSFRRQIDLSRKYAEKNNLELDESLTFEDLGISAYRSKNIKEGALKAFVEACDKGIVRIGSYLLVESLDRLSRDKVQQAFNQFSSILERGVNIVTLQDSKVYTKDSLNENFADLLISLATMFRAHEESQIKSKRLKNAWKNKRLQAQDRGKKLTSKAPAWLQLNKKAEEFTIIEERGNIIQRIFKMNLNGIGKRTIAAQFNQEKVPVFGRAKGWQSSYIQKVLENEAVIGRYQPMKIVHIDGKKKRIPSGDIIDDYFPTVVKLEDFLKAKNMRKLRKIGGGRKGKKFSNLFTKIVRCGVCGGAMHYINKGNGWAYLVCSNARKKINDCRSFSWKYIPVQAAVLLSINEIDFRELYPTMYKTSQTVFRETEDRHLVKSEDLRRTEETLEKVMDLLIERPDSENLKKKFDDLEQKQGDLRQEIIELERLLSEQKENISSHHYTEGIDEAYNKMIEAEERGDEQELYLQRSRLHQLLRLHIDSIKLIPSDHITGSSKHDPLHGIIEVHFKMIDGHFRRIFLEKGQKNAHGYKVVGDKEDFQTAILEICWPPNGVLTMGTFLEPFILGYKH